EWAAIEDRIAADDVDLLLISPERLANRDFRENMLGRLGASAGLLVVDEAHCISDWGHDFRADYRRIERVLDLLPRTVPVLGCTATANDRVVDDVVAQLGENLDVFRGPLARAGLGLHVLDLGTPAARLAWLAEVVPRLEGSGIVYCLTVGDAEVVAAWLVDQGLAATAYHGSSDGREEVEQALLENRVKVVAATSALGMGFDKPDLPFVIHFQSPGSVIAYYQQVGRAGRRLPSSVGALLCGEEDRDIHDWFISSAFPTADECERVVATLEARDGFVRFTDIEAAVNVRHSRLQTLLKNLEVDGVVVSDRGKYLRTPRPFAYDVARTEAVTALRRREQAQMRDYIKLSSGCRMAFLRAALDDPHVVACGICDLCAGPLLPAEAETKRTIEAAAFLRRRPHVIEPRKQLADRSSIPQGERLAPGRALCRWGDGGWSVLVKRGKQVEGQFAAEIVDVVVDLVRTWRPEPNPEWITWVPSLNHPELVPRLARSVAAGLGLPAVGAVVRTRHTASQNTMENSTQQLANVTGAFAVEGVLAGPCLLIDDIVDSRWTLTHVGGLLRRAGCAAVVPFALADTEGR
ncbi:MAG: RecQ family ATP-dependent DNA helicase, partial [Acidimicrobiia bacterium]|nr:RecQ family ATP-dependent DNA helicase [Acidimicrobiia bacterium]